VYERYFQLRERPFALSPDPEYLYPSKVHQEALNYLRYGIEGHAGFVVITGEIGSGKTTMLQSLLGRLDRNTSVARIVNTMLDPRELLDAIMLDFGMDPTGISKPVLLHRLAEFLVAQRQANRLVLLVIDEAQNLSLPALEEIRMLSNLETEKSKLIQIIMIGQPELREKLSLPQLQQLRQRITVSYHLQPLDTEETAAYVNHRLRRAAQGPAVEFPREVTDLIHTRSRGVPRIINVIADATLLFAYGVDRRNVDVEITGEALAELDATGVLAS
jgi:general secretion pathway protein A